MVSDIVPRRGWGASRDSIAGVRALTKKLPDVEEGTTFGFPAEPSVYSVLARIEQMSDAALTVTHAECPTFSTCRMILDHKDQG